MKTPTATTDRPNSPLNKTRYTVNLSSKHLSSTQLSVLDRGLTFIPTYKTTPLIDIYTLQDRLIRNIKLKDYFGDNDDDDYDPQRKTFMEPSSWTPPDNKLQPGTLLTIKKIVNATESVLHRRHIINNAYAVLRNYQDNLSSEERRAIQQLRKDTTIIIKPADKGSATIVMDRRAYITEAYRQLNNPLYYRKLDQPIYMDNILHINTILGKMQEDGYITASQQRYLSAKPTDNHRNFYVLPKIHKPREKWPQPDIMPEGRPIVSDVGSESYRVAEYIDHFIRPLSIGHTAYIKDTYCFVNKIRGRHIPKDAFLVTGDVTALYTNMDIDRTLAAVRRAFTTHADAERPDNYILQLLDFTLRHNDFQFNGEFFLQICGTAMGKSYAPGIADLYMQEFDDAATNTTLQSLYSRFLDDTFFVWTGTLQQLLDYQAYINGIIPGITVTLNWSKTTVDFLDTTIYKERHIGYDTLLTRVHFKATDTHQLLHRHSFHPKHTTKGVLKSQLIRFRRISSSWADYNSACTILFRSLKRRHYNPRLMRRMKHEIWLQPPAARRTKQHDGTLLPIVIPYNEIGVSLASEWRRIITANETFAHLRLINAYTTGRNLAQQLVSSRLESSIKLTGTTTGTYPKPSTPNGSFHCNSSHCRSCRYINMGNTFCSTTNGRAFEVRGHITCKTNNVVYLVTCKRCQQQYVGQTSRPLADRVNDHLSYIRNAKLNKPTGFHFSSNGHSLSDFTVMGIEHLSSSSHLAAIERTWQILLQTLHPQGINNSKLQPN